MYARVYAAVSLCAPWLRWCVPGDDTECSTVPYGAWNAARLRLIVLKGWCTLQLSVNAVFLYAPCIARVQPACSAWYVLIYYAVVWVPVQCACTVPKGASPSAAAATAAVFSAAGGGYVWTRWLVNSTDGEESS